jgi:hypothetical protein
MQITLNQDEIELAITAYVRSQISIQDTQEISIDLRAGRGETGFSATLDIRQAVAAATPAKKPVYRAPAAAAVTTTPFRKPAPVEEEALAEADVEEEAPAGISSGESREPVEEEANTSEAAKAPATRTSIFSKVAG